MSCPPLDRRKVLAALCALGTACSPLSHALDAAAARPSLAEGIDATALRDLVSQLDGRGERLASAEAIRDLQSDLASQDAFARINRRVLDDYMRDRIVRLDDWRVSQTEAVLYVALSRYT